jgi:glycerol-3-phosphate dehydrogenase
MSARLDAGYREAALRTLAETEFDVLVMGGGVVGVGAALDAAARGLSVALVEARDWASGTSSRSSKLVHGGLRYLEQLEFSLVREALRERGLLLRRLAPHLVRPVSFLYPLKHKGWERPYVGAGLMLYDTIGGATSVPMHKHLSRTKALAMAPGLKPDALTGAVRYYDAQVDDARFTMMVARTAAQHGATVVNRAEVTELVRDGKQVTGAVVRDALSGNEIRVRARRVIGATGVWTHENPAFKIQMSKGVHLVVPRERIQLDTGLIMRTEKSVLFVIPWGKHWIIGTTDTPWSDAPDRPTVTDVDIEYLLEHVNSVLKDPLTAQDVVGTYSGLRPLLAGKGGETAKLSREHTVAEPEPGYFVVAGGKFTTYRVMAADVVNVAVKGLGGVAPSLTARLPIHGAVGFHELWADRIALASSNNLSVSTVERLLRRHGSAVNEVFALIRQQPALAEHVGDDYLAAEIVHAVTHEGALDLDDVLSRRTRIAFEYPERGRAVVEQVADLIGPRLGWDESARREAVAAYLADGVMLTR